MGYVTKLHPFHILIAIVQQDKEEKDKDKKEDKDKDKAEKEDKKPVLVENFEVIQVFQLFIKFRSCLHMFKNKYGKLELILKN
jgi:hypothetical protein